MATDYSKYGSLKFIISLDIFSCWILHIEMSKIEDIPELRIDHYFYEQKILKHSLKNIVF